MAAENITIEAGLEAADQDVLTLGPPGLGGSFRGITPSPTIRTVKATFAVPPTGFEFDYEDAFLNRKVCTCAIQLKSGKKMTSDGFLRNVAVSAGVGKTIEVSLDFRGEPGIFQ